MKKIMSLTVLMIVAMFLMGFIISPSQQKNKENITSNSIPTGTYGRIIRQTCLRYKSDITSKCLVVIPIDRFVYVTFGPQNGFYYVQHPVNDYIIYLGWIKKDDLKLMPPPTPRQ